MNAVARPLWFDILCSPLSVNGRLTNFSPETFRHLFDCPSPLWTELLFKRLREPAKRLSQKIGLNTTNEAGPPNMFKPEIAFREADGRRWA